MLRKTSLSLLLSTLLVGCSSGGQKPDAQDTTASQAAPTPEGAKAFADKLDHDLRDLWVNSSRTEWVKSTYITQDTEALSAKANEEVMAYSAKAIKEAARYKDLKLDADTARKLKLLKTSSSLPAPDNAAKRARLAEIASKMEAMYGKGKWCPSPGSDEGCQNLDELSKIIAESNDYDELTKAWEHWRTISVPMRPLFSEFVQLGNSGAQEIGYGDLGDLWRSRYDMSPEEFEQVVEGLWEQVKPLYNDLHCLVRAKMAEKYAGKVSASGAMPAHIFGNMWGQDWSRIYKDVEPYPGQPSIDVDAALKAKGYDAIKMVKLGESFFTSLGLQSLPKTFY